MNTLSASKKLTVISSLIEGNSIRSTERMTGIHRDTICRLLVQVGQNCAALLDRTMRDLPCRYVECDEIWTYVGKKQRKIDRSNMEIGDQWVFVALDADTKLVPAYRVGKRSSDTTYQFIQDLSHRLRNRIQLTTDGWHFYNRSVEGAFGADVDFAQLVKLFGQWAVDNAQTKYSPSPIAEVISKVRMGNPDPDRISTSYVERQNLTMRMQMRRFTRLTNAFSKKLENLKAAVALHFAHYNFCRVHSSLRVTPAMAAGVTNEIWPLHLLLA